MHGIMNTCIMLVTTILIRMVIVIPQIAGDIIMLMLLNMIRIFCMPIIVYTRTVKTWGNEMCDNSNIKS